MKAQPRRLDDEDARQELLGLFPELLWFERQPRACRATPLAAQAVADLAWAAAAEHLELYGPTDQALRGELSQALRELLRARDSLARVRSRHLGGEGLGSS